MPIRKYDLKIFSSRLKELMKRKGVNQEELANEIGCSRKTISQYCNEKSIPDDTNRQALAKYFRVSVEYLLGEDEYPSIAAKFDAAMTDEETKKLQFEVELWGWLEKKFGFRFDEFTPDEITKLQADIFEFIQFKISQFRKEG